MALTAQPDAQAIGCAYRADPSHDLEIRRRTCETAQTNVAPYRRRAIEAQAQASVSGGEARKNPARGLTAHSAAPTLQQPVAKVGRRDFPWVKARRFLFCRTRSTGGWTDPGFGTACRSADKDGGPLACWSCRAWPSFCSAQSVAVAYFPRLRFSCPSACSSAPRMPCSCGWLDWRLSWICYSAQHLKLAWRDCGHGCNITYSAANALRQVPKRRMAARTTP